MANQKIVTLICSAEGERILQQHIHDETAQFPPYKRSLFEGFFSNAIHKIDEHHSIRAWEDINLDLDLPVLVFLKKIVAEMPEEYFHYLQVGDVPVKIVQKGSFVSNGN